MDNQGEICNLYYREGSSDKVYQASLVHNSLGWRVEFAYGRRGSAQTTGTKVGYTTYENAKKIYDKLVKEKKGKGYVEDPTGVPVISTEGSGEDSGIRPQLLNPITEDELEMYLTNDNWCAQEKFDGERRILKVQGGVVTGINRKGLIVPVPQNIADAANYLPEGIYDGEIFDKYIVIFDIVSDIPYKVRQSLLETSFMFLNHIPKAPVIKAGVAWTQKQKRAFLDALIKNNAEGIVFKDVTSFYTPGRPNSGGTQVKFKFWESCSCFVHSHNLQRSVGLSGFDQDNKMKRTEIGNVTIPPNKDIPNIGSIVEIKYLYWYKGGSLYQPQYLGPRPDLDLSDCILSKLKIKRENE